MIEHIWEGIKFFVMAFLMLGFISMVTLILSEAWRWFNNKGDSE